MKLILTTKNYVYKTEEELTAHESIMKQKGFHVLDKMLVNGQYDVLYEKEHSTKKASTQRRAR